MVCISILKLGHYCNNDINDIKTVINETNSLPVSTNQLLFT